MKYILKAGLALVLAAALAVGPVLAQAVDVTGLWRPDENSDYSASMCGPDNTQLCIKLVALRGRMDTDKNRPYLGTYLIDHARPAGEGRWRGRLTLFDVSGDATLTLRGNDVLHVRACAFIVICREIELKRVS